MVTRKCVSGDVFPRMAAWWEWRCESLWISRNVGAKEEVSFWWIMVVKGPEGESVAMDLMVLCIYFDVVEF